MIAPTVAVTCQAADQSGQPVAGAVYTATLNQTEISSGLIAPESVAVVANSSGVATLNLWPNALGTAGSLYRIKATNPENGKKFFDAMVRVPNTACFLHQIIMDEPTPALDSAQQALADAQALLAAGVHYYGALAANPTANPLGGAVVAGDLYFNTVLQYALFYTGTTWQRPAFESAAIDAIDADVLAVDVAKNTAINTTIPGYVAEVEARKALALSTDIPAAIESVKTINNRGAWTAVARTYALMDVVSESGAWHICVSAHSTTTGSVFATDAPTKWRVYQGVIAGDLSAERGAEKIGRYGQNLSVSLQNRTGGAALKKFVGKLFSAANTSRINVRLVGTSISQGDSASSVFAQALADYFGLSNSSLSFFASQAEQPINGWKTQYYSGTLSIRLRGGNGDGAQPITLQVRAKGLTLFYGTETDGGNVGVTIQTANGTVVAQPDINCSGATSINNAITYALNPDFFSTIVITPPAAGFGYLEYSATDAGDYGMMFSNTAYGGSGLWNHAGVGGVSGAMSRTVGAGMYPSAVPSGSLGLAATFAPTHAQVKPDLLIYSGPTNDAGNPSSFAGNLLAAITLAVNNGSSCILVIEPINGSTSRATWDTLRAAYYSVAATFPDSVFVYDFDALISADLAYNTKFHGSTSDPHPGDYGYGNPHTAAGSDLCARLGVPFQRKLGRVADAEMSRVYTQANEPLQAPIGSIWYDTSNGSPGSGLPGSRKRLVSRKKGRGTRGLWSCDTGENALVHVYDQTFLTAANANFYSLTQGVNFLGDPCAVLTGQSGWQLEKTKFVAGHIYTFSFQFEAPSSTQFNTILTIGTNPFFTANAKKQAFIASSNNNVSDVVGTQGAGGVGRYVCTVKWPTQTEFDAATAAGINVSGNLQFTIKGGTAGNPLSVWGFRVESGASVTNGTIAQPVIVNQAAAYPLTAISAAIEPLISSIGVGSAWSDTSNSPAVLKHLVQSNVLVNAAAGAPGAFGTGVSLWRGPTAPVNLLDQFTTSATLTPTAGTTAVKGNYGPGSQPGIRWDTTTGNVNVTLDVLSAIGTVNLTPNAVYTLSFLARCGRDDNVIDAYASMNLFINLREHNNGGSNLQMQSDLVTWNTTSSAWKMPACTKDQQYRRFKLTFKAYAVAPGSNASNYFTLMLLSQNIASQWTELSEFRLELGASVTAD